MQCGWRCALQNAGVSIARDAMRAENRAFCAMANFQLMPESDGMGTNARLISSHETTTDMKMVTNPESVRRLKAWNPTSPQWQLPVAFEDEPGSDSFTCSVGKKRHCDYCGSVIGIADDRAPDGRYCSAHCARFATALQHIQEQVHWSTIAVVQLRQNPRCGAVRFLTLDNRPFTSSDSSALKGISS